MDEVANEERDESMVTRSRSVNEMDGVTIGEVTRLYEVGRDNWELMRLYEVGCIIFDNVMEDISIGKSSRGNLFQSGRSRLKDSVSG